MQFITKSLRNKLICILFLTATLIIGSLVCFLVFNFEKIVEESNNRYTKADASANAGVISEYLNEKVTQMSDFAYLAEEHKNDTDAEKQFWITQMATRLSNQNGVSDAYFDFERGAYFSAEATAPGRYFGIDAYHNLKGDIVIKVMPDEDVAADDDWYNLSRDTRKPGITEPYKWSYTPEERERNVFSLSYPMIFDGKFVGVMGMDIELEQLQDEVVASLTNNQDGGYVILVSNGGLRAAHPKREQLFNPIGHDMEPAAQKQLQEAIKNGTTYSVRKKSLATGDFSLITYVPVTLRGSDTPWSAGTVNPLTTLTSDIDQIVKISTLLAIAALIIWMGVFYVIFGRVFAPVQQSSGLIRNISTNRDLTLRVPVTSHDEIGEQNKAFNELMDGMKEAIARSKESGGSLSSTSEKLAAMSRQLQTASAQTLNQAGMVAGTTEQMVANINAVASGAAQASVNAAEVAGAAEQMSNNMDTITAAIEEMSVSIAQIAANAGAARQVASDATQKSTAATEVMNKLGNAAKEIGNVTDVIKKIADKTNLLALNATIEAAGAGEAGKGFAVVAGEIKELANQSAKSADDIARRIEGIQSGTNAAVQVIEDVSSIIGGINESIEAIAGHVEQQTKSSNEIAANITQASTGAKRVAASIGEVARGANEMNRNAGEAAKGASHVAQSIQVVNQAARETSSDSEQVGTVAAELSQMSGELCRVVNAFSV